MLQGQRPSASVDLRPDILDRASRPAAGTSVERFVPGPFMGSRALHCGSWLKKILTQARKPRIIVAEHTSPLFMNTADDCPLQHTQHRVALGNKSTHSYAQ
ncbi:hypothetical protein CSB45_08735 [candidate division KSB3 bacterium]|uniref:Uncharacterized protein n=1 Tax=candidate division KSB3 bacterium TaxID=2044937 RepID=A0A2G6E4J1_9BACT|nr:MAG: hypothetical protein CSB45_08735 [candidate division KSB3 bacterium]